MRLVHRVASALITALYGIELPTAARIGRRLSLPHPQGVVLVGGSTIGDDCMVRHNVTLGAGSHDRGGFPTVGDRVEIGPGAIVMGEVTVGDEVKIGPGAVVITDVPSGGRALAPAASVRPSPRTGARCGVMRVESIDLGPASRDKVVLLKDPSSGLRALDLGGAETRHRSVLRLVEKAEAEIGLPTFGPLLLHTQDRPVGTPERPWRAYSFSTSAAHHDVPAPDFVFGGWPEVGIHDYDETCRAVAAAGSAPAERPGVGWIGSLATHPIRGELHRIGSQHPALFDVQQVEWGSRNTDGVQLGTVKGTHLSLADQAARWGALLDVEGVGYSGRLKILLHAGRPVLVQDRPWHEWWYGAFRPMEHYIPVRRDLADLVERACWVHEHPREAAAIGAAGQALAQRLLTNAAAARRWASLVAVHDDAGDPWAPPELLPALEAHLSGTGSRR